MRPSNGSSTTFVLYVQYYYGITYNLRNPANFNKERQFKETLLTVHIPDIGPDSNTNGTLSIVLPDRVTGETTNCPTNVERNSTNSTYP